MVRRWVLMSLAVLGCAVAAARDVDTGVIRLGATRGGSEEAAEPEAGSSLETRKAFDYSAFEARLDGLWFQRKALKAEGRPEEAEKQSDLIRAFSVEEGIHRVDGLAGALLAEARRYLREGDHEKALRALDLAEALDPGRSQVRLARAAVFWRSGEGAISAAREFAKGVRAAFVEKWRDFSLLNDWMLAAALAATGFLVAFAVLMLLVHHVALRHDLEERLSRRGLERWSLPVGVAVIGFPLWSWVGAAWSPFYWIVLTFRYMKRRERLAALLVLALTAAAVPGYRFAVALYGLSSDPLVRTSVAAASGRYDPDQILRMREMVEAKPDEPVFRFLLAGLYRNGRYFEEAFAEYKWVLADDPSNVPALINTGNVLFQTGQYGQAITYYRRAVAADPQSLLAFFNMHLAQSESFGFKEAEASLSSARDIDARRVAELLAPHGERGERPSVVDAALPRAVLLGAILGDTTVADGALGFSEGDGKAVLRSLLNPLSVASVATMLACLMALLAGRTAPASRCVRCGRPFCLRCKKGKDGPEFCSQCVHLFVLGDGLAPETKTMKMYEVKSYGRTSRIRGRALSAVLPGAGQILAGRTMLGGALMLVWIWTLLIWLPWLSRPVLVTAGLPLRLDLLRAGDVPTMFSLNPVTVAATLVALATWFAANLLRMLPREE